MKFREHLLKLDPRLLIEGEESINMSSEELYEEIKMLLAGMEEDELDEFGAFLSVEFFDTPEEELEELYFDFDAVLEMIDEMVIEEDEDEKIETYSFILELLLPEDFETSKELDYENPDEASGVSDVTEAVSRVMKAKNRNLKKRKFFQKSAATLRKERAQRMKANRVNRASRRAYTRVNKDKIKSYQKSRAKFMRKGKHFAKIRRQTGE